MSHHLSAEPVPLSQIMVNLALVIALGAVHKRRPHSGGVIDLRTREEGQARSQDLEKGGGLF